MLLARNATKNGRGENFLHVRIFRAHFSRDKHTLHTRLFRTSSVFWLVHWGASKRNACDRRSAFSGFPPMTGSRHERPSPAHTATGNSSGLSPDSTSLPPAALVRQPYVRQRCSIFIFSNLYPHYIAPVYKVKPLFSCPPKNCAFVFYTRATAVCPFLLCNLQKIAKSFPLDLTFALYMVYNMKRTKTSATAKEVSFLSSAVAGVFLLL